MRERVRPPRTALAALLGAALLLLPVAAHPQGTAKRTILGQVLDENDKVVATAVVHLINVTAKEQWSTITDKEGRYEFNGVDPKADFQLFAERGEQKSRVHSISQFDTRTRIVVNLKLQPAKKPEEKKEKENQD